MRTEEKLNKNGKSQGMHPNSRMNLDRGRVGNNHAEKDYSITRILKEMANDPVEERWLEVEDKGKGLTWRQAAAKRIWIETVRGNAKVTGELLDRVDGKVTQPVENAGKVIIEWSYQDRGMDGSSDTA